MKNIILCILLLGFTTSFSYSQVGKGEAQIINIPKSNYGQRLNAIRNNQPDPGPTQQSQSVTTPTPQDPDWITSVGTSESGKRAKIHYQLDGTNHICSYCGFQVWDYNSWISAFGALDPKLGYYIEYLGEKYYF